VPTGYIRFAPDGALDVLVHFARISPDVLYSLLRIRLVRLGVHAQGNSIFYRPVVLIKVSDLGPL